MDEEVVTYTCPTHSHPPPWEKTDLVWCDGQKGLEYKFFREGHLVDVIALSSCTVKSQQAIFCS